MRFRLWPFVSFVFAVLLGLVVLFAWSLARKSRQIDARAAHAHELYQRADDAITNIRGNVYRTALLSHETTGPAPAPEIQKELAAIRASSQADLRSLTGLLGPAQRSSLDALARELVHYWQSPALAGDNEQRQTVLTLAKKIDAVNESSIRQQESEIHEDRLALRRFAFRSALLLVGLSVVIALAAIVYLARLESRSEAEKKRAEEAEYELRRLSQQLVRAQEEERKSISRELHDEVGQILTGLRLELGALSPVDGRPGFEERVNSMKALAEDALRAVRNLSLLLRPPMLDDLGLGPALRWQAREFARRIGVPISVDIDGDLEDLPEAHRICLYRVVQEALTNSARHAAPARITVTIRQTRDVVEAVIRDDGRGFPDKELRTQGLGLTGMDERIRTLQGSLSISSRPGEGTELHIALPLYAAPEMLKN
jgi:signal transduction histidine kinase